MKPKKLQLVLFACSCIAVAAGWLFAFSYAGLILMLLGAVLVVAAAVAGRSWFGSVAMVVAAIWFFGAFPLAVRAGPSFFGGDRYSSDSVQTPDSRR